jgi:hypothetical protein
MASSSLLKYSGGQMAETFFRLCHRTFAGISGYIPRKSDGTAGKRASQLPPAEYFNRLLANYLYCIEEKDNMSIFTSTTKAATAAIESAKSYGTFKRSLEHVISD